MSGPAQPGKYYRLGGLRFEHQLDGRWGVSNGIRGVCNHRTPIGAWLALRRFMRVELKPPDGFADGKDRQ